MKFTEACVEVATSIDTYLLGMVAGLICSALFFMFGFDVSLVVNILSGIFGAWVGGVVSAMQFG